MDYIEWTEQSTFLIACMNEDELGHDSTNIFFSSACSMWYTLKDTFVIHFTICLLNIVSLLFTGDGKYSLSKLGVITGPFFHKKIPYYLY